MKPSIDGSQDDLELKQSFPGCPRTSGPRNTSHFVADVAPILVRSRLSFVNPDIEHFEAASAKVLKITTDSQLGGATRFGLGSRLG